MAFKFLMSFLLISLVSAEKLKDIYIGGVFPMTGGWAGGQACRPAVKMAIDDINNSSDVLQGRRIILVDKDSKCNAGLGLRNFYEILGDERIFTTLTGCSSVSTPIAESAYVWRMNVIAYGASSPALSNRSRFPTFFRTHPSANLHNPIRVRLFREFGWKRVAIIHQTDEVFATTAKDLRRLMSDEGIEVGDDQRFHDDPRVAVHNLKKSDIRIIVGLFYEGMARKVICEAYKSGMYGPKYVWFLIGWYQYNWHLIRKEKINCTGKEMTLAVEGHFTTEILMLNPAKNQKTVSGMSSSQFISRLDAKLGVQAKLMGGYAEAPLAYDAVWAFAIALNTSIARTNPRDISRKNPVISAELYRSLNVSSFLGVSGRVVFDSDGSRMAFTKVERFQNGSYVTILFYDSQTNNISWVQPISWLAPPSDRMSSVVQQLKLSRPVRVGVAVMGVLCALFCCACLAFNWANSKIKIVSNSVPTINSLSVLGNLSLVLAVSAFGLSDVTNTVCQTRLWLLVLGSTLFYSPLFAKLWTLNSLYKQNLIKSGRRRKREELKMEVNRETIGVIVFAFSIDFCVLITWLLVDPLRQSKHRLLAVRTGEDSIVIPELQQCVSNHFSVWIGIVFAYKGIQLLLGSFLAYESRCKMESNSDHKVVAIVVYNVTILCFLCAPANLLISGKPNVSFLFVSAPVLASCCASNAILFIPKWQKARRGGSGSGETPSVRIRRPPLESEEVLLERENARLRHKIAEREMEIEDLRRRKQSGSTEDSESFKS